MKPNRADSDERQARTEEALFQAIISLQDTTECRNFFKDLCTPAELQALVDRWQVVAYLEQGLPYREIHERTAVSVTTIGRVARFLTDGYGGYQTAYRRASGTADNAP
ncbi:MAG TPA: YerC/YecD family TrpR-related protein [Woeseiaceae bacterium]|nr:YerC/YecD family TrpR-related protein [Woeseiaceae bacterium]